MYPEWRKEELRRKWALVVNIKDPSERYGKVKSFVKDEFYPTFKHARGINSRSDEFKCFVGPVFKAIESEVYKNHHFIKHVPVLERSAYIRELLHRVGVSYLATDYSAFESLFSAEVMEQVEFRLYSFMTRNLPIHRDLMWACHEVLGGQNTCHFRDFVVKILAKRMSGEMCTSLGNGFTNLMLMLCVLDEQKCTNVEGVVEGDDGLFVASGTPPTAAHFAEYGFVIKLALHETLSTASFCGIIFEPGDDINLTDPLELMATLGWAPSRYIDAKQHKLTILLRCKALSYAHQYNGCPVVTSVAGWVLRNTRDVASHVIPFLLRSPMNTWDKEMYMKAARDEMRIKPIEVPVSTRLLFEREFLISVEHQLVLERYFNELEGLGAIEHPLLDLYLPQVWRDNFVKYTARKGTDFPDHLGHHARFKPEF